MIIRKGFKLIIALFSNCSCGSNNVTSFSYTDSRGKTYTKYHCNECGNEWVE